MLHKPKLHKVTLTIDYFVNLFCWLAVPDLKAIHNMSSWNELIIVRYYSSLIKDGKTSKYKKNGH